MLLVVLAISIINGKRRGFISSVLSLIAVFAAVFIAIQACEPLANWTYDNFASKLVVQEVEKAIPDGFDSTSAAEIVTVSIERLPEFLAKNLKTLGIDAEKIVEQVKAQDLSKTGSAQMIADKILRPGVVMLLKMLCFIVVFLVSRAILGAIIGLIDKFFSLPVLKTANGWLGAALGAAKGGIAVYALCIALAAVAELLSDGVIAQAIDSSRIVSSVSNFNNGINLSI